MHQPLVSVVIPTYNCGPYLAAALDSVLEQDYAPFEVIAVDDGSTDDTLDTLARYAERVRVVRQDNRGPAAARNRGVREARGDYLAFLDGDDLWLPGKLSAQMQYLITHPSIQVVYSNWSVWFPEADGSFGTPTLAPADESDGVDTELSGHVYIKLLFDSIIHIISAVIHRSVHAAVGGFDESLRTGSDYDFWVRVGQRYEVAKLARTFAVYRQNTSSVSHVMRRENNAYRLLKRAIDTYGLSDNFGNAVDRRTIERRLAGLCFLHGYRHFWRGDTGTALRAFARGWLHQPADPKMNAYVALSALKYCFSRLLRRGPSQPDRPGSPRITSANLTK